MRKRKQVLSTDHPTKQGTCDHCNAEAKLMLAFDRVRYICIDPTSCLLQARRAKQS